MENKIAKEFLNFVDRISNAYICVEYIKELLINSGFEELYENGYWNNLIPGGKYFVIRNDSSLISFKIPEKESASKFNIVSAHTDSPSFSIKNNPDIFEKGYLKLNINGYGGMINYTWFDRPLSLAGRVIVLENGEYRKYCININKDLLVIPSLAIHMNRDVNSKLQINPQTDMLPIMSMENRKLVDIIKEELNNSGKKFDSICDYDLYLYNRDSAKVCGLNNEFILAPRLDDLACLYPAIKSFIESNNNETINVCCAFNNEEIGSMTMQGADSTFLIDTLDNIAKLRNFDIKTSLNNSFIVSADNAHAIHPNFASKSDITNEVSLNKGIVIKHHTNYSTDSLTSSIFKGILTKANSPYQDFSCRADIGCGSTLGKISQTHVSVKTVDIGLPQLAMHSANEFMGCYDIQYLYKGLLEFYNTNLINNRNSFRI